VRLHFGTRFCAPVSGMWCSFIRYRDVAQHHGVVRCSFQAVPRITWRVHGWSSASTGYLQSTRRGHRRTSQPNRLVPLAALADKEITEGALVLLRTEDGSAPRRATTVNGVARGHGPMTTSPPAITERTYRALFDARRAATRAATQCECGCSCELPSLDME
jgi:hypothetical protein